MINNHALGGGAPAALTRMVDQRYLHEEGLPVPGGPIHQGLAAAYAQARGYAEGYRLLHAAARLEATAVAPLDALLTLLSQEVGYAVTLKEFSDDLLGAIALVRQGLWPRRCRCTSEFPPQSCRNEDALEHYTLSAVSSLIDTYYGRVVTTDQALSRLRPAVAESISAGVQAGAFRLQELLALQRKDDYETVEVLDTHVLHYLARQLEAIS